MQAVMKMKWAGLIELTIASSPKGIDQAHAIGGVPGAVTYANIKSGYLLVDDGLRIEPVYEIEVPFY